MGDIGAAIAKGHDGDRRGIRFGERVGRGRRKGFKQ